MVNKELAKQFDLLYPQGVPDPMIWYEFLSEHQAPSLWMEKPKQKSKNGFYQFLMEKQRSLKAQGIHVSMKEAAELAGLEWEKMDAEARQPYKDMASNSASQDKARPASSTSEQRPKVPVSQGQADAGLNPTAAAAAMEQEEQPPIAAEVATPLTTASPPPPPAEQERPQSSRAVKLCLRLTPSPPPSRTYPLTRPQIMKQTKVAWKPLRKPRLSVEMPPIREADQEDSSDMQGDENTTEEGGSEDFCSDDVETVMSPTAELVALPSDEVEMTITAEDAARGLAPSMVLATPEMDARDVSPLLPMGVAAGAAADQSSAAEAGDVASDDVATERSDDDDAAAPPIEVDASHVPPEEGPKEGVNAEEEARRAKRTMRKKAVEELLRLLLEDD